MPQNQIITSAECLKSRSPKLKDAFRKNGERLGLTTLYSVFEDGETTFRCFEECAARAYAETALRIVPGSEVMLVEEQVDMLVCEAREIPITPAPKAQSKPRDGVRLALVHPVLGEIDPDIAGSLEEIQRYLPACKPQLLPAH